MDISLSLFSIIFMVLGSRGSLGRPKLYAKHRVERKIGARPQSIAHLAAYRQVGRRPARIKSSQRKPKRAKQPFEYADTPCAKTKLCVRLISVAPGRQQCKIAFLAIEVGDYCIPPRRLQVIRAVFARPARALTRKSRPLLSKSCICDDLRVKAVESKPNVA